MRLNKTLLGLACITGLSLAHLPAQAAEQWCASGKPVKFAGLNWESGMLLTNVMEIVLKEGYGCTTDSLPGNSITLEQALANNDIQVFAEEWIGRSEVWNKAAEAGKVTGVGAPIKGAVEGWYVPRYLVDGSGAKAPDLKAVADLRQYAELFRDPEEPSKGRFYNCPAGWTCELENSEMLKRYELEDSFTNFRPGTGPALDAVVQSSYRRKEPIVFYYWSPTPLIGQLDLVKLDEPGVNRRIEIQVGLSKTFHDDAPELVAVLEKVNFPIDLLNENLARMAEDRADVGDLAKAFLKQNPDIWHAWVSADAAKKIDAAVQ
jgi:glycine betaine/proline transport system substrate-binding protein